MFKEKGFSLIEILIVLGILATLIIFASTRKKNPQKEYQRFFRRFSLMSKNIRNQALITNSTYRMVFYLEDEQKPQIWVEKANKSVLLENEKESREKFKDMLESIQKNKIQKKDSKKKEKNTSVFSKASRFNFEKLKMPKNLRIKQLEVSGLDYIIEDGLIAFHYFPHGLVEETSIQFTNLNGNYKLTLISDSINGEFFTIQGHKSLEELQKR